MSFTYGAERLTRISLFFFLNDPPPTEISPLPLHDALPISRALGHARHGLERVAHLEVLNRAEPVGRVAGALERVLIDPAHAGGVGPEPGLGAGGEPADRKSTRLNSSH